MGPREETKIRWAVPPPEAFVELAPALAPPPPDLIRLTSVSSDGGGQKLSHFLDIVQQQRFPSGVTPPSTSSRGTSLPSRLVRMSNPRPSPSGIPPRSPPGTVRDNAVVGSDDDDGELPDDSLFAPAPAAAPAAAPAPSDDDDDDDDDDELPDDSLFAPTPAAAPAPSDDDDDDDDDDELPDDSLFAPAPTSTHPFRLGLR